MIPKIIHYCWFGNKELPDSVKKCIDSWKIHCPDYKIIEWNESNYDINKNDYIKEAYQQEKYAFVSDFARLDIVYTYGGIYLDTDVELIKKLDPLLVHDCYMGLELIGRINTGLGFGAKQHSAFLKSNMEQYLEQPFSTNKTCIDYTVVAAKIYGFNSEINSIQNLQGVTIYPEDYFCPYNMETSKIRITENTYSVHHYDASWYGGNKFLKKKLLPVKIKTREKIDHVFGDGAYQIIKEKITKWKYIWRK